MQFFILPVSLYTSVGKIIKSLILKSTYYISTKLSGKTALQGLLMAKLEELVSWTLLETIAQG